MALKRAKPLNILDNKGFWPEKAAVLDAVKEILALGGARGQVPVRDYGSYRTAQWRDENNNLVPWQSVDWYIYDAMEEERMQVDASRLLYDLASEPWRDGQSLGDHYDLFLMEEDMYRAANGEQEGSGPAYCVGSSEPFSAAVISTHRIEHIWGMPYSYIKTEVMRQLCFLFAVPSQWRQDVVETAEGGRFCTNVCILREAREAPDDWEKLTLDRLRHGPLCEFCLKDLRQFFVVAGQEDA